MRSSRSDRSKRYLRSLTLQRNRMSLEAIGLCTDSSISSIFGVSFVRLWLGAVRNWVCLSWARRYRFIGRYANSCFCWRESRLCLGSSGDLVVNKASKTTPSKKGCSLNSLMSFAPSLFSGTLTRSLLIKFLATSGTSSPNRERSQTRILWNVSSLLEPLNGVELSELKIYQIMTPKLQRSFSYLGADERPDVSPSGEIYSSVPTKKLVIL